MHTMKNFMILAALLSLMAYGIAEKKRLADDSNQGRLQASMEGCAVLIEIDAARAWFLRREDGCEKTPSSPFAVIERRACETAGLWKKGFIGPHGEEVTVEPCTER